MLDILRKAKGYIIGESYESLASEPQDRGAQSRTVKQFREEEPISTLEVQVLDYLSKHQDELVTHEQIARGSGVQKHKIGATISKLVGSGTVVRSTPSRNGTRYWINGGSPNPIGKNTEDTFTGGTEGDDIDFVKITNDLVWSFIRATRSTDVLLYLTWLEQQGEKDG